MGAGSIGGTAAQLAHGRGAMMMHEPLHFTGLRGTLTRDAPLAPLHELARGGRADTLYLPADRDDLAAFLRAAARGRAADWCSASAATCWCATAACAAPS